MDHLAFFRELNERGQAGGEAELVPYGVPGAGQDPGAGRGWLVDHPTHVQHVMVRQERNFVHSPHPFLDTAPLLTDIGAFMLRLPREGGEGGEGGASRAHATLATVLADQTHALVARLRRRSAAERRVEIACELKRTLFDALCVLLFDLDVDEHESAAFVAATGTLERWRLDPDSVSADAFKRAGRACQQLGERINRAAGASVDVNAIMPTIFNGYSALSTTLTWTLALLVHHPRALARVEGEVLATRDQDLGERDLGRLPFARAAVQEGLRLYPPAWLLQRRSLEAARVGEQQIEPGDTLSVCTYTLHRDPRFWDQADTFDPARFLADDRGGRPKHCYLPFGAGRRVCPAEQLGVGMVLRVLVGLVEAFSIRAAGELPRALGLISLCPDPDVELALEPRS